MPFFRIILILSVLFLFPLQVQAQTEDVVVYTETWENYTNKDGTGFYLDILREVYPAPRYNLIIEHHPYKRCVLMVEQGHADLTTGVFVGDLPESLIVQQYVEIDAVDVAVKKVVAQNWQGLQSLRGKKVVAKIGYEFGGYFDVPVDYTEKSNLLGMMTMLGVGRVDAVLDYAMDMQKIWQEAGLGDDHVIISGVILGESYFAFASKSQKLRDQFEEVFPQLVTSGKVLEIGLKYNVPESRLPR